MADEPLTPATVGALFTAAGGAMSALGYWAFSRIWTRLDRNEQAISDVKDKYVRRDDLHDHLTRIEKRLDQLYAAISRQPSSD